MDMKWIIGICALLIVCAVIAVFGLVALFYSVDVSEEPLTTLTEPLPAMVKLTTNYGDITIELDQEMPITAGNFAKLVKDGYYDGLTFHRIIDGFMIQGGCPRGDGTGGPGYAIEDEFTPDNRNDRGTISMANSGPNTGGSQFFINLVDNNYLDTQHPVFGKVVEGMDTVDMIGKVQVGRGGMPIQPVIIEKAEAIETSLT